MQRALPLVLGLALGLFLGFVAFRGEPALPPQPNPAPDRAATASDATLATNANFDRGAETAPVTAPIRESAPTPTPSGPTIDYEPAFGTFVYGMARSTDGTPIEECTLSFSSVADTKIRRRASVEGGRGFALTGLTPGRWNLYSKPADFAILRQEVEIFDTPTQRLDLTFSPSFLVTVKIQTPDGQPLHEAIAEAKLGHYTQVLAVASKEPIQGNLPMTELRGYSRFGIGSWRAANGFMARERDPMPTGVSGILELSEPPPIYVAAVFRHLVLATATVNPGDKEVILEVPLETVRESTTTVTLRVINAATGLPVESARVGISDSQSGGAGRPTDADGRITLENERVGILELDIWAKDLEHYHDLLRLTPGEHDLGTIALHPPREVVVKVVDATGEPTAGATIQWQNLDRRRFPQPSMYRRSGRTESDGTCKLSGLGSGRYLIQAFVRGQSQGNTVVNTAGLGDEPVVLTLAGTHKVDIAATFDVPRSDIHCLTIFDRKRVPVWARFLRGYPTTAELPAGHYVWELHAGTQLLKSGKFDLNAETAPAQIGLQ